MCANQATPGELGSVIFALTTRLANHNIIKSPAGILIIVIKKKIKTRVDTLAFGNNNKFLYHLLE